MQKLNVSHDFGTTTFFFPFQRVINFSDQHFTETNEQYHTKVGGKPIPADLTIAVAV